MTRNRCPSCGAYVTTIFDHVDIDCSTSSPGPDTMPETDHSPIRRFVNCVTIHPTMAHIHPCDHTEPGDTTCPERVAYSMLDGRHLCEVHAYAGGCALMLDVEPQPGWGPVRGQAEELGWEVKGDQDLHLTVVFFGRDMRPQHVDEVREAVGRAMQELSAYWHANLQQDESLAARAAKGHSGGPMPAFVVLRFPGEIGQFQNKSGTHLHAVAEVNPALLEFREAIIGKPDRPGLYPRRVRADFGGYRPHVTLAEGPAGSRLAREARVPAAVYRATGALLKLGQVRESLTFR